MVGFTMGTRKRVELDDEDVEAVIFANLVKHHFLLPPRSTFRAYWDLLMFLFVIYNSIFVPIDVAYFNMTKRLGQCSIDIIIDLLFITDMLLNLRTTYYDEENELVLETRKIYKRYLCSYWFVIDLLAVFPFDLCISGWVCEDESRSVDSVTAITKLLKTLRLLRLVRFRKELDRLSGAAALRAVVSLCVFLLVAHWLACIWWAVGFFGYRNDEAEARAALGLGDDDPVTVICDNTKSCSWIRRLPAGNAPLTPDSVIGQQYLSSMYWSLTTLVKTPWIGPDSITEKVVAICAIGLGAIVYASFLSTVQGSYASYNKANAQKRDKVNTLTGFMNAVEISDELRAKLLKHTNTQAEMVPLGLNNTNVLMQLPSHLRGVVSLELYSEACDGSRLFNKVSLECAKALAIRLQYQLVMPEQVLIAKGEVCNQLFILLRGALRVTTDAPAATSGTPGSPFAMQGGKEPAVADADESPTAQRRSSSRKSKMGVHSVRELERPGLMVGIVEPQRPNCFGLYPAWVAATKKTLVLSLTQGAISQALDGFGADAEPLRNHLMREHKAMLDSLKLPLDGENSPYAACEAAKESAEISRTKSDAINVLPEDAEARVRLLEEKLTAGLSILPKMQKDMDILPKILKMVNEAKSGDTLGQLSARS